MPELLARVVIQPLKGLGRDLWRAAIRFRKKHIEADDSSTGFDDPRNHLGHDRARPWPLPQSPQALLVDIHDRDEVLTLGAWIDQLIDIERLQANSLNESRIQNPEHQQAHEEQKTDNPAGSEAPPLFQKMRHDWNSARTGSRA
ncbi:hypothetical protein FHR70_000100 [Microvirga lupini]|uniref:Uncharacterized protein n=1 Tax=Microvirga lupini TaxID=420324 RepID=A0A7W4YU53_9HYPH|nr:hypothetical protein [Microvirga lupini]